MAPAAMRTGRVSRSARIVSVMVPSGLRRKGISTEECGGTPAPALPRRGVSWPVHGRGGRPASIPRRAALLLPPGDERVDLLADRGIQRRGLVGGEQLLPHPCGPDRRVGAARLPHAFPVGI